MRRLGTGVVVALVFCASLGGGTHPARAATPTVASASFVDSFDGFDSSSWTATAHALGLGQLRPQNVGVSAGSLDLLLPGGTLDGGEIESTNLYGYGSYRARMTIPDDPASITGFFLYAAPDGAHEIDVELVNDPRGQVMFTTYFNGDPTNPVPTHTTEPPLSLGFDPTAGSHEYGFDYTPSGVSFYVDGRMFQTWTTAVPTSPMHLFVNAWYPTWLGGKTEPTDGHVLVDQVSYTAWLRATASSVTCVPSELLSRARAACTIRVADVDRDTPVAPSGTVAIGSSSCLLTPDATAGVATCNAAYTAGAPGRHAVDASYPGDARHTASSAATTLTTAPACVVPRLAGSRLAAARKKLAAADCRLGGVRHARARRSLRRRIVGQSPKPGEILPAGANVTVAVGR